MRMTVATAVACLLGVGISTAHDAQAAIKRDTTIPAQGLGSALKQLANERDIQLVYRSELVGQRHTSGAVGELTFDEALTKLLNGTGLTYQYLDDRAVTIVPMDSRSSSRQISRGVPSGGVWERFRLAQVEQGSSASPNPTSDAPDRRVTLEEVVVTAQKREERLQDVPISISVLSGDHLDSSSLRSVNEELNRVPGTAVFESAQLQQIMVRGVGTAIGRSTGASPIGYYLDSVPFGFIKSALVPDTSAFDLDRVEVLRGPQGTLYGASAMNGVVRVLTKNADVNDYELKARASGASIDKGGMDYRGDIAANLPLVDGKWAVRVAGGYQQFGGWLDKPIERDANSGTASNVRVKSRLQATDRLTIDALLWHSESEFGAPNTSSDNETRPSFISEPVNMDYDVYGLQIAYDFDALSITSATSYIDFNTNNLVDQALAGLQNSTLLTDMSSEVLSQEIYLNSRHPGPWRWSIGGSYRDAEDDIIFFFKPFYVANSENNDRSESVAAFGELARKFFDDKVEILAGLRYFRDEVDQVELSRSNGQPPLGVVPGDTFSKTTGRIVVSWQPSESVSAYASYSEGFRSGFLQATSILAAVPDFPAAKPDLIKNYELGAKGRLWDGLLGFDSAVYFMKWEDIQQSFVFFAPGFPPTGLLTQVNTQSASGLGVDLGLTLHPVDGLSLGTTVSWNDLTLDEAVVVGGIARTPAGARPNASPEWTASAFADYAFPLGAQFEGRLAVSGNYISARSAVSLAGQNAVVVDSDPITTVRTSFSIEAHKSWSATLFVDNLSNENGIVTNSANPNARTRIQPRTIGLQLEYRY